MTLRALLKEMFRPRWWKLVLLAVTTFIFLFVNVPAMSEPCNWRACPDYPGTTIFSLGHVNFYTPAGYRCGFACIPHKEEWSYGLLRFDIIAWLAVNGLILYLTAKKVG